MTVDHLLPDRAKNVPAIREALIDQWRAIGKLNRRAVLASLHTDPNSEVAMLADSQLVWVAESFLPLMRRVADTVPDNIAHDDAELLWPRGLAVFQEPVLGIDTLADSPVKVNAICWGPVLIMGRTGTGVSSYTRFTDSPELPGGWVSIGRSDWMADELIGDVGDRGPITVDDHARQSFIEDRKMLVALHRLMAQEKYVERSQWEPQSKSAKRRAAGKGGNYKVEIVHLRRERVGERPEGAEGEATSGGRWHHRWWVDPYPRWQPYGPGRALRKLIIVEGHMRGPKDKPFLDRERVYSLDR